MKLKLKNKIGYGIGDLASNLVFQMTVIYLLFFYTDILGISPYQAMIIFLIARIWDSINDPIMGLIVDHTKSRYGKARVYLLFGSLPLALSTIAMFFVPNLGSNEKFIYALVTYLIWGMLYTLVNIPYSSLTSMMTDDQKERTSLSSIRMIFMLIGVIVVSVLTEPLLSMFSTPQTGFLVVTTIYSLSAFLLFLVCFLYTDVTMIDTEQKENYHLNELMPLLLKNSQFILVTLSSLLGSVAVFIRETSAIYYVNYNIGNSDLLPLFLGVIVIAMVIGNLIIPSLNELYEKREIFLVGALIAIIGSIILHFIPYSNLVLILLFGGISSFGISAVSTIGWSMIPDTVEFGQWKTGKRTEGIIYSVYSFSQKLATAISGGIVALILDKTSYVNGGVQSTLTLNGIKATITIIPVAFLILSSLIIWFYKLDKSTFNSIKKEISNETNE